MKKRPSEGNSKFCIAPWTHTYLSPQSERRMCCASREPAQFTHQYIDSSKDVLNKAYQPITLKEHWNSEHMKSVRRRLMAGEEIPECVVCNEQILNLDVYRNYFNETLFPHLIEEAFNRTDDDGHTTMPPRSYDYRVSNLCNFKCRMCGDQLSSSWENESRERGLFKLSNEFWVQNENREIIDRFQKEVAAKELWEAVKSGVIEEIYWVGGEPLLWEIHWEIMEYLVRSGLSKNVKVRYNTNLSVVRFKNLNLYELLPNFKDVMICASIDGTKEIGEYIRYGLKWERWLKNFEDSLFLKKQFGELAVCIDLTVTSPGLFSIKDLIDLSLKYNVTSLIKTTYSFDSSIVMTPMMIPRKILDPILDKIINYAKKMAIINPKINEYVKAFSDIKAKKTFEEEYPDWYIGLKLGKKNLELIDKHRKESGKLDLIFKNDPALYAWWTSL